ncbi:MAG: hypothetical protein PHW65_05220 [Dehalococcoidales bacterium]|nr:hypothetical protein [Dehalococcoidales bacterium]
MPSDFLTLDYLSTFAGMVAAVALIVQFTKGLIKQKCSDYVVRWYTFVLALAIVALVQWYNGCFAGALREVAAAAFMVVVNGVLVALAAMGGYEVLADPQAEKTKFPRY